MIFTWFSRRLHRPTQPTTSGSTLQRWRTVAPAVEELEPRVVMATNLFTVPGAATAQTTLDFVYNYRNAVLNNEVGVYAVQDGSGTVNGIAPGAAGYVQAALQSAQVLFPSGSGPNTSIQLTFTGGQQLAFYIVQNSTTQNALASNPTDHPGGVQTYFSVDGVNPDGRNHVQTMPMGDGTTQFGFADTTASTVDEFFTNEIITVGVAGSRAVPVPGQNGQTVPVTFDWIDRDTGFNNELGLFAVDNAQGSIGTLNPGDPGYAQAALSSSSRQVIFASGEGAGASITLTVPGATFFGMYLVVNDSTAVALAQNPTDSAMARPFVWFAFPSGNFDGFDHMMWVRPNDFAWTDGIQGLNLDWFDLVAQMSFGAPQGQASPPTSPPPATSAPAVTAALASDTGASASDKITSDPSIKGTVSDAAHLASFKAGFDATPPAQFVDISASVKSDGTYTLTGGELTSINGAKALTDGSHTLHLIATNTSGTASPTVDVTFTLKTTPPKQPAFDLDAASADRPNDQTDLANVTLTGTTDANTSVELVQTKATTTSDASGKFSFTNVPVTVGANSFTVTATDVAGNTSQFNKTITRTSATKTDNPPTVVSPISNVSLAQKASQTIDLAGNFDDPDITDTMVVLNTSAGPINIELFNRQAPRTVANFLNYITSGRYNDSIFHRSAKNPDGTPFVLQGGGFTFNATTSTIDTITTDPPVQNEPDTTNRSNLVGTLAMAKLGSDPNSATDQFFFNLGNNSSNLDNQNGGFTVFGKLVGSADMQVVNALAAIPTQDQSNAAALPASEKGVFNEIPLQNYSGTNFPTDTTLANYAVVNTASIVSQGDFLTYSVVGNTNPNVASTNVVNERLTVQAGQTGTTTITVQATDQSGKTVSTSFNVTVS